MIERVIDVWIKIIRELYGVGLVRQAKVAQVVLGVLLHLPAPQAVLLAHGGHQEPRIQLKRQAVDEAGLRNRRQGHNVLGLLRALPQPNIPVARPYRTRKKEKKR